RPRSARRASDGGRRAGPPDELRIPRALLSDAPSRPRRLAGRVDRAHLRAGRRPRFEHRRSVHRAAQTQAGTIGHRNGARARIPHRERVMSSLLSVRARVLLGAVLWTFGLFMASGIVVNSVMLHHPNTPRLLHAFFAYPIGSPAAAALAMVCGLWQV